MKTSKNNKKRNVKTIKLKNSKKKFILSKIALIALKENTIIIYLESGLIVLYFHFTLQRI